MKAKLYPFLSLFVMIAALLSVSKLNAQQINGTVKGFIYTSDNKPADNVTVTLDNTTYGTITNENGYFEIKAPAGSYQLRFAHVGVQSKDYAVQIFAGKTTQLPNTVINAKVASLREVSISGNKVNKFKFKRSEVVAKMPLDNLENPQSYSTVTKELLTEQTIFNADDAVKNAPGVQKMWAATGRGGDGGAYYSMRGFTVQSQLRNGISGNVTNSVDAINIERVEVIRGPSATLFGSTLTSYGGLINRVTKKPTEGSYAEINYTGGSYNLNRGSLDLNAPLTADKKLLFRLNTAYTNQGSFQDNAFNKNFVVDPSLTYKVNDKLSFSADAELSYGRTAINTIYFFPYGQTIAQLGASTPDQLGIDYKRSYFNKDLSEKSRNTNYFVQMDYKLGGQWKSQTNFSSVNSFSDGFGPYFYLLPHDSLSREDQSTRNSKYSVTEIQENINGDFKIGNMRNRVVLGLDFMRINSNQYFYYGAFDRVSASSGLNFNYDSFNKDAVNAGRANGTVGNYLYSSIYKTNTYSAYVSDALNITDQLIALAGLRVDNFHNMGNFDPTTSKTSGAYNQTAFSPKLGLVYQLIKDQISLFGNYQNGFKNQTGVSFSGTTFKPEHANQIEGGIKFDVLSGKLSSTLSYYSIQVKDILRTDPEHPQSQIQNGTQDSKGVEGEIIANPVPGFNFVAGFAYNDSKYKNADPDVNGLRPSTAMSPFSANVWASYRFQQGKIKGLGLGFGGNYASDNKVVNSVSQGVFTLPAYAVFNSTIFYDKSVYRIGLTVNNLTNKEYYIGYTTVNPQMLRQVLASFTFRF